MASIVRVRPSKGAEGEWLDGIKTGNASGARASSACYQPQGYLTYGYSAFSSRPHNFANSEQNPFMSILMTISHGLKNKTKARSVAVKPFLAGIEIQIFFIAQRQITQKRSELRIFSHVMCNVQ